MSNDRLILSPEQNTDHFNPSYIASLASRIYNEVPGAAEGRENAPDVKSFSPTSVPDIENIKSEAANKAPENVQNRAFSQVDIDTLDLSVFGLNNPSLSSEAGPLQNELKNFYFFPDGIPSQQVPLSNHTENLVSQQALKGEPEVNNDLSHFVQKAQSVSGGFGQADKGKPT